jgi:micrococcal nuclease
MKMGLGVKFRVFVLVCLGVTLSGAAFAKVSLKGSVTKIVDGDTVWFQQDGTNAVKKLTIRMIGEDTPETHLVLASGGMASQEPWGTLAAQALAKMAPLGSKAILEDNGLDKYKRTLGRVIIQDKDINLAMVRSGWGIPYIICEGKECDESFLERENVAAYFEACKAARDDKQGIFDTKNPLTEMPFEFRLRMQKRKADKFVGSFSSKEYFLPEDYREVDVCDRVFFMNESDTKKLGFTKSKKYN